MNEQQLLLEEARRRGISVAQLQMMMAAPDYLMADLRADARRSNPVTSVSSPIPTRPGEGAATTRGSGWQDLKPLSLPPGVAAADRLMDAQDILDRRDLERRLRSDAPKDETPADDAPDEEVVPGGVALDKFFEESLPDESLLDAGLDELGPNELDLDPPAPDDAA